VVSTFVVQQIFSFFQQYILLVTLTLRATVLRIILGVLVQRVLLLTTLAVGVVMHCLVMVQCDYLRLGTAYLLVDSLLLSYLSEFLDDFAR
jgi:hypothetical protein